MVKSAIAGCFNRSNKCIDFPWFCLFITLQFLLIILAVFSFSYCNYLPIVNGYDSFGNVCGVKNKKRFENFPLSGLDTSNKPYVLFFSLKQASTSVKICTDQCPFTVTTLDLHREIYLFWNTTKSQICRYDFNMSNLMNHFKFNYMSSQGPCPSVVHIKNTPIRHRCLPRLWREEVSALYSTISYGCGIVQLFFIAVYLRWHYIAVLSGLAVAISIVLLVMMRWLIKIISWLICSLVFIASMSVCIISWREYNSFRTKYEKLDSYKDFGGYYPDLLPEFTLNENLLLASAILSSIITESLAIVICFFKDDISKPTIVFEESFSCLINLPSLMKVPIITLLVFIVHVFSGTYIMLYMSTASHPEVIPLRDAMGLCSSFYDHNYTTMEEIKYIEKESIRNSFWIYIGGFIWLTEFILACKEFLLGAAVAHWYFEEHWHWSKCVYCLGTIARGSLLFAFFRIPLLILNFFVKRIDKINSKHFSFFQGVNTGTYTIASIAMTDLTSARKIAEKTMSNAQELEYIQNIGKLIFFFGKLFVAMLTCLIGILMVQDIKESYFYMAPVLLSAVLAFLIAHIVFSIIRVPMDALVHCLCEDNRIHGNGEYRWMQNKLSKYIGKTRSDQGSIQVVQVAVSSTIDVQPFRS